jgi:hypothetical protein
VAFGRTASKRLLGSMNDFAWMAEGYLDGSTPLLDISLGLAETPCGRPGDARHEFRIIPQGSVHRFRKPATDPVPPELGHLGIRVAAARRQVGRRFDLPQAVTLEPPERVLGRGTCRWRAELLQELVERGLDLGERRESGLASLKPTEREQDQ